jgi:hypothetical protein
MAACRARGGRRVTAAALRGRWRRAPGGGGDRSAASAGAGPAARAGARPGARDRPAASAGAGPGARVAPAARAGAGPAARTGAGLAARAGAGSAASTVRRRERVSMSEREKKEKPSVWLSSTSLPSARDAALSKDFLKIKIFILPSAPNLALGKIFAECLRIDTRQSLLYRVSYVDTRQSKF